MLHTRGTYARAVLTKMGMKPTLANRRKTRERVTFMLAWGRGEFGEHPCNGVPGEGAKFNLFATTRYVPGAWPYNSFGPSDHPMHVYNYPTWKVGVQAIADTLANGNYDALVAVIRAGQSASDMCAALAMSPWGTGDNALRALPTVLDQRATEWLRGVG